MKESKTEKTKKIAQLGGESREDHTTQHQQERPQMRAPLLCLLGVVPCFISGPQRVTPAGSRHCLVGTDQEGTRRDGCSVLQPSH